MNLSPTRYHLEMLATEIQGHLPVVLEWPGGHREEVGQWSGYVRSLLRYPGDRPLDGGTRPILLIHDATRQPWQGRPPAIYVTLGAEVEG